MTTSSTPSSPRTNATTKKTASVKRPAAAPKSPSVPTEPASPLKSATVKVQRTKTPQTAKTETPVTKEKKVKVMRDSFTIPKNEFSQLGDMKKKALGLGLEIKKSELIRAGLMLLNSASDAAFKKALANVPTLKTGRPGKN